MFAVLTTSVDRQFPILTRSRV